MKNKEDLLFIIVGLLLAISLAALAIYSISFLIEKINIALNMEAFKNYPTARIDFEELKKIGIME